jgi:hypothetical protein
MIGLFLTRSLETLATEAVRLSAAPWIKVAPIAPMGSLLFTLAAAATRVFPTAVALMPILARPTVSVEELSARTAVSRASKEVLTEVIALRISFTLRTLTIGFGAAITLAAKPSVRRVGRCMVKYCCV